MNLDQLRTAHRAMPFRPFIVRMADGRFFLIQHPDFLSIAPSGRTVIVYELSDALHILDANLMTEVEVLASAAQP